MGEAVPRKNLPILLGIIRQETGDGELVLEQNDGARRFYFLEGELIYLKSDAVGEQFGSYLLRQDILDLSTLNELLANDEGYRLGEKIIQWGMMSLEARDHHLQCLQEQIMIHALEHPILHWTWNADSLERLLSQDLHFKLQHRHFIWRTFQTSNYLMDLLTILKTETTWKWEGRRDLVDHLSDLPLTPTTAYALSFLTTDPIGFEGFRFLSSLDEDDAGRFIVTLWALGALVLSSGKLPSVARVSAPSPVQPTPLLPLIMPPPSMPFGPPKQRVPATPCDLTQLNSHSEPEFIDPDQDPEGSPAPQTIRLRPRPDDMPPCGPRPQPRSQSVPRPDDMPPCGARPQPRSQPLPPPDSIPPREPQLQLRPQLDITSQPRFIELDPDRKGIPDPPKPQALVECRQLFDRACRQVRLGRTLEAVITLEQAVQLQPDGDAAYEPWLMLGQLRMTKLTWSTRAIHALQNASRIRTRETKPWTTMGEIYHRTGCESDAVACFRRALELDPSVAIPPGMDLNETPNLAPRAKPSKMGLFGKFRSDSGDGQ